MQILKTNEYSSWEAKLRDLRARAHIDARIRRLGLGHFSDSKSVGDGVTKWDIQDHLKTPEERAYYIEAAIEEAQRDGDLQFLSVALADVARSIGTGKVSTFLAGVSAGAASVTAPRTARRKTRGKARA